MNKTPEELAKEYCNQFSWNDPREEDAHNAFLAGYQAAKDYNEDTLLAAFKAGSQSGNNVMPGLSGYIPADFNDFLLSLLAKDQVANVSKAMPKWNSVDTVGDLINRSAIQHTLAALEKKPAQQWISVKERLPALYEVVLVSKGPYFRLASLAREQNEAADIGEYKVWHEIDQYRLQDSFTGCLAWNGITHWMPLPTAPKEEV